MEYKNINGFNVRIAELKDFIENMDDKEILEVIKVDGHTFLHRSKTSEIYYLSEPEAKDGTEV